MALEWPGPFSTESARRPAAGAMGNANSASVSRWDDLFQALTRPDELKTYLVQNLGAATEGTQSTLRTQIDLLTGTLQVEEALLKVNEVAESFDTATFCLGQLVSHEPQLMSELSCAMTVVEGLACALRKGWLVHHGVGKFAANALTILCICETAAVEVRTRAIDELLSGLVKWLHNTDPPQEVDEVCGCNCGCASLSATCWLERLLGKPDQLLEEKIRAYPTLSELCRDLLHVVSRHDGNPFALTRLLCVPEVFPTLMRTAPAVASDAVCFLTFGLLQFDNPMFTEDAVQVRPAAPAPHAPHSVAPGFDPCAPRRAGDPDAAPRNERRHATSRRRLGAQRHRRRRYRGRCRRRRRRRRERREP